MVATPPGRHAERRATSNVLWPIVSVGVVAGFVLWASFWIFPPTSDKEQHPMTSNPSIVAIAYDIDAFQAFLAWRKIIGPIVVDLQDVDYGDDVTFSVETETGLVQLTLDLGMRREDDEPDSGYRARLEKAQDDAVKAVSDKMARPVYRGTYRHDVR